MTHTALENLSPTHGRLIIDKFMISSRVLLLVNGCRAQPRIKPIDENVDKVGTGVLMLHRGPEGFVQFVAPRLTFGMFTPEDVIKIFYRMGALDTGGRTLRVISM